MMMIMIKSGQTVLRPVTVAAARAAGAAKRLTQAVRLHLGWQPLRPT